MMNEASLLVHGDDIPVPYDRFRDQRDVSDDGFARACCGVRRACAEKDVPAKYLNSSRERRCFTRAGCLQLAPRARKAVHDGAQLIVVEGYVDVDRNGERGISGAVAPLGTALTEDQLGLLWKMSDEPLLCFDGDNAGRRAAYRAVEMALPRLAPGKSVLICARCPKGRTQTIWSAPVGERRHGGGSGRCAGRFRKCFGPARPETAQFETRLNAAPDSRRGSIRSQTPSPTSR